MVFFFFWLLIQIEEIMDNQLRIFLNIWWETTHLAKQCVLKLAQHEVFKAYQLWKESICKWMSKSMLAKFKSKLGVLLIRTTVETSPYKIRELHWLEGASWVANNATWTLSKEDSTIRRRLAATSIIFLSESLRIDSLILTFHILGRVKLVVHIPLRWTGLTRWCRM